MAMMAAARLRSSWALGCGAAAGWAGTVAARTSAAGCGSGCGAAVSLSDMVDFSEGWGDVTGSALRPMPTRVSAGTETMETSNGSQSVTR